MNPELDAEYEMDLLAAKAGGYVKPISEEGLAFMHLLFDLCKRYGIRYYSADEKDRYFVEEVARVTWAHQQEKATGIKVPIRPAFSAPGPAPEAPHPKIPEVVLQAASLMQTLSEDKQRTAFDFIKNLAAK